MLDITPNDAFYLKAAREQAETPEGRKYLWDVLDRTKAGDIYVSESHRALILLALTERF